MFRFLIVRKMLKFGLALFLMVTKLRNFQQMLHQSVRTLEEACHQYEAISKASFTSLRETVSLF